MAEVVPASPWTRWIQRLTTPAPPPREVAHAATEPLLGGRYRLVERVAAGRAATVWRGVDTALDLAVAIKLADGDRPLRDEARVAMGLSHPGIVRTFGWGEHEGREFLVMEWIAGGDLARTRRLAGGALGPEVARDVGICCLAALAHAHARGVLHHDLKPANLLSGPDGWLLCDFGLSARVARPGEVQPGSPVTMSPERLAGAPGDARSDLFSLAATLWILATGHPPYGDGEARLVRGDGPLPLGNGLPPALRAVLARALDPDPARRWPDAEAMRAALADAGPVAVEVVAEEPPTHVPPPARRPADPGLVRIAGRELLLDDFTLHVAPFRLARTPVTNGEYAAFVAATGAAPPAPWHARRPPPGRERHPVVGASLDEARAYAAWRGLRLPTGPEWLAAQPRVKPPCDPARCQCGAEDTSPVDAHPRSATEEGVLDLRGNVWEWVDGGGDDAWAYGGSYRHRCPSGLPRTRICGGKASVYVGFRCAEDAT